MGELRNCPKCGKLFVKTNLRDTCEACYREEEALFVKVYDYVRQQKNREATIEQVVEDTGVDEDIVIRFIKSGRIKVAHLPNLGYPCEKCSAIIQTSTLCESCKTELKTGWNRAENEEKAFIRRKQQELLHSSYLSKNNVNK